MDTKGQPFQIMAMHTQQRQGPVQRTNSPLAAEPS